MKKNERKVNWKWYIKERHNPQTGIYYVGMGQLSKATAKRHEKPVYGENYMLPFETEKEYNTKIACLEKSGKRVTLNT